MAVPVYGFFTATPRAEYWQLAKEGRHSAWWQRLGDVMREKCPNVESIIMCDRVDSPSFLYVQKFPDMETLGKYNLVVRQATHLPAYFDVTTLLGWKREDWQNAFGKLPVEKESW